MAIQDFFYCKFISIIHFDHQFWIREPKLKQDLNALLNYLKVRTRHWIVKWIWLNFAHEEEKNVRKKVIARKRIELLMANLIQAQFTYYHKIIPTCITNYALLHWVTLHNECLYCLRNRKKRVNSTHSPDEIEYVNEHLNSKLS